MFTDLQHNNCFQNISHQLVWEIVVGLVTGIHTFMSTQYKKCLKTRYKLSRWQLQQEKNSRDVWYRSSSLLSSKCNFSWPPHYREPPFVHISATSNNRISDTLLYLWNFQFQFQFQFQFPKDVNSQSTSLPAINFQTMCLRPSWEGTQRSSR